MEEFTAQEDDTPLSPESSKIPPPSRPERVYAAILRDPNRIRLQLPTRKAQHSTDTGRSPALSRCTGFAGDHRTPSKAPGLPVGTNLPKDCATPLHLWRPGAKMAPVSLDTSTWKPSHKTMKRDSNDTCSTNFSLTTTLIL